MICPDVFEMLLVDAVVEHQLQGFGADSLVPIGLSYPVTHLAVVFSNRDAFLQDDASCVNILVQEESGEAGLLFPVDDSPVDGGCAAILWK